MITSMILFLRVRSYRNTLHEFYCKYMHSFNFLGDPVVGSRLYQVTNDDPLLQVGGDFNEWFNVTGTIITQGAASTSNGLYVCEVCLFRGTPFEECHLANTSLQVIGGPPILDVATDNSEYRFNITNNTACM